MKLRKIIWYRKISSNYFNEMTEWRQPQQAQLWGTRRKTSLLPLVPISKLDLTILQSFYTNSIFLWDIKDRPHQSKNQTMVRLTWILVWVYYWLDGVARFPFLNFVTFLDGGNFCKAFAKAQVHIGHIKSLQTLSQSWKTIVKLWVKLFTFQI